MMAAGLSIEECVSTIAATLPVCSVRGVAYSTFTIIHIKDNETADIIQYDNPQVILIRNNENYDYPKMEMNIDGKRIYKSTIKLCENDIFIAMSDGCPHAGIGTAFFRTRQRKRFRRFLLMNATSFTETSRVTMLLPAL